MQNSDEINDEEFIQQFEGCTLPASAFHHRDHLRITWLYLHRYSPVEALARLSENIRRFAAANGKAERYHETITWAYVFLVRERIERSATQLSWLDFTRTNPDLFDWNCSILYRYYRKETLGSELARQIFVFPDIASETHQSSAAESTKPPDQN